MLSQSNLDITIHINTERGEPMSVRPLRLLEEILQAAGAPFRMTRVHARGSLDQQHLLLIGEAVRLETVDVKTARQSGRIKADTVVTAVEIAINQHCHFLANHVVHFERDRT